MRDIRIYNKIELMNVRVKFYENKNRKEKTFQKKKTNRKKKSNKHQCILVAPSSSIQKM